MRNQFLEAPTIVANDNQDKRHLFATGFELDNCVFVERRSNAHFILIFVDFSAQLE
jgi:hypothetical protein